MNCDEKEIIGITGGIGSGKSVVSRILRLNGFPVYDCDHEAKRLMVKDAEVRMNLIDLFGDSIYFDSQTLNRKKLSALIFSDQEMLRQVNKIVHKAVKDDFVRFCDACSTQRKIFCESAILYTSRLFTLCNRIWLIVAPEEIRMERVGIRSGMCREEVEKRMRAQQREFDNLPKDSVFHLSNSGEPILFKIKEQIENTINFYTSCLKKF